MFMLFNDVVFLYCFILPQKYKIIGEMPNYSNLNNAHFKVRCAVFAHFFHFLFVVQVLFLIFVAT